jgi:hypothetical protein
LSEFLQTEHAINAIYPHRHHLSAKVRSFIDLLAKHFHHDPAWADASHSGVVAKLGTAHVENVLPVSAFGVAAE